MLTITEAIQMDTMLTNIDVPDCKTSFEKFCKIFNTYQTHKHESEHDYANDVNTNTCTNECTKIMTTDDAEIDTNVEFDSSEWSSVVSNDNNDTSDSMHALKHDLRLIVLKLNETHPGLYPYALTKTNIFDA